ncbi:hypothetical protein [Streptomyces sp. NPDC058755]|uniref:hypothetical protein n=1 Tax=Streptomyces sp. NPDC058755 TaxID=3346624 RepID=UPI0036CEF339
MALIVVAIVTDLGTAGAVASVVSGVVALAGLTLSVFTLVTAGNRTGGTVSAGGERAVAVGGNAGRVITGDHTTVLPTTPAPAPAAAPPVTPPATPSPASQPDVSASGSRAAAVGGNAEEIITGDGTHL